MADLTARDMVSRYILLRDKVAELKKKHAAELKPYTDFMDALEASGMQMLTAQGSESLRTDAGTMFKSELTSYKVDDPLALRQWALTNNRLDVYPAKVIKSAMEELIESTGKLPPGVSRSAELKVNFRR